MGTPSTINPTTCHSPPNLLMFSRPSFFASFLLGFKVLNKALLKSNSLAM